MFFQKSRKSKIQELKEIESTKKLNDSLGFIEEQRKNYKRKLVSNKINFDLLNVEKEYNQTKVIYKLQNYLFQDLIMQLLKLEIGFKKD